MNEKELDKSGELSRKNDEINEMKSNLEEANKPSEDQLNELRNKLTQLECT